jgi:glycosyltransferase involved in cell wall biosynthesis
MRILLVNESARSHTGGAHRVVVETVGLLRAAGHTVGLAYSDGGPSEVDCSLHRFSFDQTENQLASGWEEIRREFQPDITQIHLTNHPFFLGEIARFGPVCRYLHDQSFFCSAGDRMLGGFQPCHRPHGPACLWHHYASGCGGKNPLGNWERWSQVQQKMDLSRTMHFQIASKFMAQGLRENQISPERIHLVPLYAREPAVTGVTTIAGRIVVASRLVPAKGVHVMVAALRHLPETITLVIAGDGPERARLEEQARDGGVAARVRFCGEISADALDAEIAAAELVVSPTLRPEPFGLIGPEAMAHAKPLVAFDGGATPEWLVDGENGVLIHERTPEALAAAIKTVLDDSKRAAAMGNKGREMWRQNFAPGSYVSNLVASLEKILDQR